MKILDRYIITRFIGTFIFTMILILLIAVIFDVSERINDFTANDAPLNEIIVDYYLSFMTMYGNQFSALIIFIAVIFFTSRMAGNTEVIAILSGGVSFNRFLRPFMIAATILALASGYFNNYLVPKTNEAFIRFKMKYIDDNPDIRFKNIHRRVSDNTYIYFESFNTRNNVGYHFSMEQFEGDQLVYKLKSDFARYDSLRNRWTVENYVLREISPEGEVLRTGRDLDTTFAFTPSKLAIENSLIETMNYNELNAFIEEEKRMNNEKVDIYYIEQHRRFSLPFASYILTLIGVSISFRKQRGGIGLNLAIGFITVLIYIFFMQISITFATKGNLAPWLAVWMPNMVFGIVSLILYRRALQ